MNCKKGRCPPPQLRPLEASLVVKELLSECLSLFKDLEDIAKRDDDAGVTGRT